MITSKFIFFFFLFIIISYICIGGINNEIKSKKYISSLGCMVSLMIIVGVCFFPFPYQDELLDVMITNGEGLTNNFIPFATIIQIIRETIMYHVYGNICYQLFGNILLFIPLGLSLYYYIEYKRKFLRVVICIIFISILVEGFQGFFNYVIQVNYRSVDVDDIILNTFGGMLGYSCAMFIVPEIAKLLKRRKNN